MIQYCHNCGTRLNGEAYCPRCQRAAPSPIATPPRAPVPSQEPKSSGGGKPTNTNDDSKTYAVKAVVCGVVFLVGAVIVAQAGDAARIPVVVVGGAIVAAIWNSK